MTSNPRVSPAGDVGDLEGDVRQALARRLDHVGRTVDANDPSLRVALAQDFGRIARAAADVGGARDAAIGDALHEIPHRPRALLLELDVLGGGPGHRKLQMATLRSPRSRRAQEEPLHAIVPLDAAS
jgi:hypothetical protein